jgi:tungstate transport system permease protein
LKIFLDAMASGASILFSGAVDVWEIVVTSLRVSGVATGLALVLGIPAGFLLGTRRSISRWVAVVIANAGMGLPPVVVGLVVAMTLSRRGPLGQLDLLYTQPAMVIAQFIIAVPVVIAVTGASIGGVPRQLRLQARSLGASRLQEAMLMLKEARLGVIAAVAAGFGAVISEVGASQMTGGNLKGSTQVMTTAVVEFTRKGDYGPALALSALLLAIVVFVNVLLTAMQTSGEKFEQG